MATTGAEMEIKLDVRESDGAYKAHADIPGVKKEDISVAIDGNAVTISAEVRQEKEEKGEHTLRSERYYGALSRSFTLATAIDEKAATARYADGVLELVLPKKPDGAARKLRID